MAISGSRNRQKVAISGARNLQNGGNFNLAPEIANMGRFPAPEIAEKWRFLAPEISKMALIFIWPQKSPKWGDFWRQNEPKWSRDPISQVGLRFNQEFSNSAQIIGPGSGGLSAPHVVAD